MLELEKVNQEWEVTDVAEVNWTAMAEYLEERVRIKIFWKSEENHQSIKRGKFWNSQIKQLKRFQKKIYLKKICFSFFFWAFQKILKFNYFAKIQKIKFISKKSNFSISWTFLEKIENLIIQVDFEKTFFFQKFKFLISLKYFIPNLK